MITTPMTHWAHSLPARHPFASALLSALLLSACGGGGEHAPTPMGQATTPPAAMQTVSDTATAALGSDPNGGASATPSDADAPGDPGAPTQIATDTSTSPNATANDAEAPSEPPASTV